MTDPAADVAADRRRMETATTNSTFFFGELFARHSSGTGVLDRNAFLSCLQELADNGQSSNPAAQPPLMTTEEQFKAGEVYQRHATPGGELSPSGFLAALDEIRRVAPEQPASSGGVRAVLVPDEKITHRRAQ